MKDALSVTEVRNALRCPRVFVLGRRLGREVAFPVGASSLGAVFHRLADRFARQVESPPADLAGLPAEADAPTIALALSRWLITGLTAELRACPALWDLPTEVDDLAEALRQLADHLAALVREAPGAPAERLARLLVRSELPVSAVVAGPEGDVVRVNGRIDALVERASRQLDLVEYKLTDESRADLDRAQAALYRFLLAETEARDATPVILRFLPGLQVTRLTPAEADALVHDVVLPLVGQMPAWLPVGAPVPGPTRTDLCAACPVREACVEAFPGVLPCRDRPPAGGATPRPTSAGAVEPSAPAPASPGVSGAADAAGAEEAQALAGRILEVYRQRGVSAVLRQSLVVGPRLVTVFVSVSRRGSVKQLDAAAPDVQHVLGTDDGRLAEYERQGPHRRFRVERLAPRTVDLGDLLARGRSFLADRPGRFVLGETAEGELLLGDLGDPGTPHLLVGGQSGSGKSVLLRSLVSSLAHLHPPAAIQFHLVDPKRVTFTSLLPSLAAHLADTPAFDVEEILPRLDQLRDEMEHRYSRFDALKVQDLDEHNEVVRTAERRPRIVLVVDEFQDLTASKASAEAFLAAVKRLGAKARAAGIHLILATQRPDARTVPGDIKANLGGRIALRVQAAVNSRIILDQPGAERLLGKGDLLADLGHGLVRAQAPLA